MKRDGEIRNIEMTMSTIGNEVEEINETLNAKLAEFVDTVERIKASKLHKRRLYKINYKKI